VITATPKFVNMGPAYNGGYYGFPYFVTDVDATPAGAQNTFYPTIMSGGVTTNFAANGFKVSCVSGKVNVRVLRMGATGVAADTTCVVVLDPDTKLWEWFYIGRTYALRIYTDTSTATVMVNFW
jgi:hypothetical protein